MHELSIAMSIIEMAEETSDQHGGAPITAVHLKLGPLSGVVKRALENAFFLAREGTALETANLVVEETPVIAYCLDCGTDRILERMQFVCPVCNRPTPEIVSGRELEVTAFELEEVSTCPPEL